MTLLQDIALYFKYREQFSQFLATTADGVRIMTLPKAVPTEKGIEVEPLFVWGLFTQLNLPGITEHTIFSHVDARYIVYPRTITEEALRSIPSPPYTYQTDLFDCDDIAEWGKLMLKQILIGCPVAYMEGYTDKFGHAFCLVPCSDGYIWYGWDEQGVRSCKKITFIRI